MNTQPEALRLADALEKDKWHITAVTAHDAASELRRLHAQRDALLEALQLIAAYMNDPMSVQMTRQQFAEKAKAAIAKATEENK